MKKALKTLKNVFTSTEGLIACALIIGGLLAADFFEKKVADPTASDVIEYAFFIISILGTSMLTSAIVREQAKNKQAGEDDHRIV